MEETEPYADLVHTRESIVIRQHPKHPPLSRNNNINATASTSSTTTARGGGKEAAPTAPPRPVTGAQSPSISRPLSPSHAEPIDPMETLKIPLTGDNVVPLERKGGLDIVLPLTSRDIKPLVDLLPEYFNVERISIQHSRLSNDFLKTLFSALESVATAKARAWTLPYLEFSRCSFGSVDHEEASSASAAASSSASNHPARDTNGLLE